MVNLWGPGAFDSQNPSATRPPSSPDNAPGDIDDWFKDCTDPLSLDGTEWRSALLNLLIANLRSVIYGSATPPSNLDDALLARAIQSGGLNSAVATGTANDLIVALGRPLLAHRFGMVLTIRTGGNPNTGPMTLKVDGLAPASLLARGGSALGEGAVPANSLIEVACDGTNYRLLGLTMASKAQVEAGLATDLAVSPKELFDRRNPFFIASGTSSQSIPDSVDTKVTNIGAPSASYFNTGSSFAGSAFTCGAKDAGAWLFVAYGALTLATASAGGNDYRGSIAKNGSTGPFASTFLSGSSTYGVVVMNPYVMEAGDFVDFRVFQNTGTNRNIGATQLFGMRLGAAA